MKHISLLLLPLGIAQAGTVGRRAPQHDHSGPAPPKLPGQSPFAGIVGQLDLKGSGGDATAALIKVLPKAHFAVSEPLKPQVRQGAKRHIAKFGPYTLTGKGQPKPKKLINSLDPNGQAFIELTSDGMCSNCTILAGKPGLLFEDGSPAGPAQGVYIHHILSHDISKKALKPVAKCVGSTNTTQTNLLDLLGAELFSQGDDNSTPFYFTSEDGAYPSGFFVGSNDSFALQADLVNYNADTRKVYVTFDIEYVDGHVGSDAVSTLLSVGGCGGIGGGNAIALNQTGPAETTGRKIPILVDGKIISAKGHMHIGGERMILLINDKEVCVSAPIYTKANGFESIAGMPSCPEAIPVKKGDTLTMKSVYDLAKHPLRSGAEHNAMGNADVMGMFILTWAVDGERK
ncbi:hypothetical protein BT63DRAFT_474211 [Microthyrium microscopicum]|uniref:Uncharacterized protein n=1 Tax=Microthyrium microscopicum TaxID=703497 RepID=A0A6A6UTT1_9PEZI|nr:hypothetical protein BT63DRAFT_474211 [Microthyrium microscopicum]